MPFALTEVICKANRPPEEFFVTIVYGASGLGKSTYQCKVTAEVMKNLAPKILGHELTVEQSWELTKKLIVYHPDRFFSKLDEIESRWGSSPILNWDDGGLWLFAMSYNEPFVKEFLEWLNVARTTIKGTLIISTPTPFMVLRKLREFPNSISVKIVKAKGEDDTYRNPETDKWTWMRIAKGYRNWMSADWKKTGVRSKLEDIFSCRMPDEFFEWYQPVRKAYEQMARARMREKWERLKAGTQANLLEKYPELKTILSPI
jgi:hypothetical protein